MQSVIPFESNINIFSLFLLAFCMNYSDKSHNKKVEKKLEETVEKVEESNEKPVMPIPESTEPADWPALPQKEDPLNDEEGVIPSPSEVPEWPTASEVEWPKPPTDDDASNDKSKKVKKEINEGVNYLAKLWNDLSNAVSEGIESIKNNPSTSTYIASAVGAIGVLALGYSNAQKYPHTPFGPKEASILAVALASVGAGHYIVVSSSSSSSPSSKK